MKPAGRQPAAAVYTASVGTFTAGGLEGVCSTPTLAAARVQRAIDELIKAATAKGTLSDGPNLALDTRGMPHGLWWDITRWDVDGESVTVATSETPGDTGLPEGDL
ncbi:MAG: hypothetical protein JWM31_1507 [Solirubrobacterales bacterium]|nr:hypothetical protein [Solirubrobacterales bacterium]